MITSDLYSKLYNATEEFFKGDRVKTALWWNTPSPMFGGLRPVEMFLLGREQQLQRFIETSLSENKHTAS